MNDMKSSGNSRNLNLTISIQTDVGQSGIQYVIKYSFTNIEHFLSAQVLQDNSKPRNEDLRPWLQLLW